MGIAVALRKFAIVETGVSAGNVYKDTDGQNEPGERKKAWLFGHFMPNGDPRQTSDLCIAMNDHHKGITREAWAFNKRATTLSILLEGFVFMEFPEKDVLLSEPGDYVMWGCGVPHRWRSEDGTKFMSVRWPSLAGDSHDVGDPRVDKIILVGEPKMGRNMGSNDGHVQWIPVQYKDGKFGIAITDTSTKILYSVLTHARVGELIRKSSRMPQVRDFEENKKGHYIEMIVFDGNSEVLISHKLDFYSDWEPGWEVGSATFPDGTKEKLFTPV